MICYYLHTPFLGIFSFSFLTNHCSCGHRHNKSAIDSMSILFGIIRHPNLLSNFLDKSHFTYLVQSRIRPFRINPISSRHQSSAQQQGQFCVRRTYGSPAETATKIFSATQFIIENFLWLLYHLCSTEYKWLHINRCSIYLYLNLQEKTFILETRPWNIPHRGYKFCRQLHTLAWHPSLQTKVNYLDTLATVRWN